MMMINYHTPSNVNYPGCGISYKLIMHNTKYKQKGITTNICKSACNNINNKVTMFCPKSYRLWLLRWVMSTPVIQGQVHGVGEYWIGQDELCSIHSSAYIFILISRRWISCYCLCRVMYSCCLVVSWSSIEFFKKKCKSWLKSIFDFQFTLFKQKSSRTL